MEYALQVERSLGSCSKAVARSLARLIGAEIEGAEKTRVPYSFNSPPPSSLLYDVARGRRVHRHLIPSVSR